MMRALILAAGFVVLAVSPAEAASRRLDPQLRAYLQDAARNEHIHSAQSERDAPTRVLTANIRASNGRKLIAVFVSGGRWCGVTGNCDLMILERDGRSFKNIGQIAVADVPVRLLVTHHHGMPDLSCWVHDGANNYHEQRVWFDGRKYRDGRAIGGYAYGRKIRTRVPGAVLIPRQLGERLYP